MVLPLLETKKSIQVTDDFFLLQGQGLLSLLGRKLKCLAVDFSVVVLVGIVGGQKNL